MKREGRQQGMVRTYTILPSPWNSRPHSKFINRLDSPPTAGMFTRVQLKPTGHSKFTGKCGRPRCNRCHMNPCCKSKDKAKGNHKARSLDVVSNYRLLSWRVVDGRPGLNFSGFSATGILDHLANDYEDDDVDDSVFEDDDGDGDHEALMESSPGIVIQEIDDNDEDENDNGGNPNISNDQDEEEEDDRMSFCDVGLMWAQAEDINQLLERTWSVQLQHVYHEGNQSADLLAALAQNAPTGFHILPDPPPELLQLLRSESQGTMFRRRQRSPT